MKLFVKIFFCSGLLIGCTTSFTTEETIGTYTPVGYRYTFDTIQLKSDGIYHRKIYDKTKKLVMEMDGQWSFYDTDNNAIQFRSYFLNLDRDLTRFPELLEDTTGGWVGDLQNNAGTIEFCVGYFSADLPDQNCYRKIK